MPFPTVLVVSDDTMPQASGLELLAVLGEDDATKVPHDLVDRVHALLH